MSWRVVSLSTFAVQFAAGINRCVQATLASLRAQAVWLSQHLWVCHRDHPRLG